MQRLYCFVQTGDVQPFAVSNKKHSAFDSHPREWQMSLCNRARRESFASETLCYSTGLYYKKDYTIKNRKLPPFLQQKEIPIFSTNIHMESTYI